MATIALHKHAGGLIQITAVPPTSVALSILGHRIEGHTLVVSVGGQVQNIPDQTLCGVSWTVQRGDDPRSLPGASIKLPVKGGRVDVELTLDLIEAGVVGAACVTLSLSPQFPPFEAVGVGGAVELELPCSVDMAGLADVKAVGQTVLLTPRRHEVWAGYTLQIRIEELDPPPKNKGKKADSVDPPDDDDQREGLGWEQIIEWGPAETEPKVWRVGCTEPEGDPLLCTPDPGERGMAEVRLTVRLIADQQVTVIERVRCDVARPVLTRLELVAHNEARNRLSRSDPWAMVRWLRDTPEPEDLRFALEGQIEGLAAGFPFPVEVTLWGRKALPGAPGVEVMEPLGAPIVRHTDAQGRIDITLLDLSTIQAPSQLTPLVGYRYFAVLRLPPGATGTDVHLPVAQGLDYDPGTFRPFLDEDFSQRLPARPNRKGHTAKELGTGVCSSDLGHVRPVRMPHFAWLGHEIHGTTLVLTARVHGELHYWCEAAPKISLVPEHSEPIALETAERADDPRVYEAKISMIDERIKGCLVEARVEVTNALATLDGLHPADTAPPISTAIHCSPSLGPITWSVGIHQGQRVGRIGCEAHYFPTFPGAQKGLRMQVLGYYEGMGVPMPLPVKLRYAIPDGNAKADGRVGTSGVLEALVDDPAHIDIIEAGRIRVEVWRHWDSGRVLDMPVPRGGHDIGAGDRPMPVGQIIFASKVSAEFKQNLRLVAQRLGVDPNHLMAVMAFETGEKFAATKYPNGAVGLIQFTTEGAEAISKTKDELARLSPEDQLLEVERYYRYWIDAKGPVTSLEDAYMVVFCPSAVGQSLDHVLYSEAEDEAHNKRYYARNKGLDVDGSGTITKAEAAAKVREKLQAGMADLG